MINISEFLAPDVDLSPEGIEKLQTVLMQLNSSAQEGNPLVADAVYDKLKSLLQSTAPDSQILHQVWDEVEELPSTSDLDVHLRTHPMGSILTVKSYSDPAFLSFCNTLTHLNEVTLHFSAKIDGHGVRVVYKDGQFVKATTRARSTRGRDITRQLSHIVPPTIPQTQGIVEIRGEVCLQVGKLNLARQFTPTLKTAFSAVSSLIKDSSTPEENQLLDFKAYKYFSDTPYYFFESRSEEYEVLKELGFSVPEWSTDTLLDDFDPIQDIPEAFDYFVDNLSNDYFLDGVVLEVDSQQHRNSIINNDVYVAGALALKTGQYAQGIYTGIVHHIDFKPGRTKLSPVAVLTADSLDLPPTGILTETGNTVLNVPLYEPANIYHLQAYPGLPLSFMYGGEAGVVPCFPDGTLLTEALLEDLVRN